MISFSPIDRDSSLQHNPILQELPIQKAEKMTIEVFLLAFASDK
jgi:hypothetical protein